MRQNCYTTHSFPNVLLLVANRQMCYGYLKNYEVESVRSSDSAETPCCGRVQGAVGEIPRIPNARTNWMCELI